MNKGLVVVAGAGGFIGGHLVRALLEQGRWVRAVDRKPINTWWQYFQEAENCPYDLRNMDQCLAALQGAREVYNLACFDQETEILTRFHGWKKFSELSCDEQVATIGSSGHLEWQIPTNYVCKSWNGELLHFTSEQVDICVTPDHMMYVRKPHWLDYRKVIAADCDLVQLRIKTGISWHGKETTEVEIPINNKHHNTKQLHKFRAVPFLTFMGFYLADGCCRERESGCEIRLANTDEAVIKEMVDVVAQMGFKPRVETGSFCGVVFYSRVLYEYLHPLGHAKQKYVPQEFKELSSSLLRHLHRGLMLDGSHTGRCVYYSSSKRLADDFAEICLKLGYSFTISQRDSKWGIQYTVYFRDRSESILINKPKRVMYNSNVYCVSVPNGLLYVRRNGKPCVIGNCDMGGIGFIENNKVDCMLTVLTSTNLLQAAESCGVRRFFFASSACVYAADKQTSEQVVPLKEADAYPAMPEDGYGWEKLFSERMCRHFMEDYGLETRVARLHNCFGPQGCWHGGREKAPAAICRKVIQAKLRGDSQIEIWGDGNQKRSFMYIDDCVKGILAIMASDVREPLNLGSSETVTINGLVDIVESMADIKLERVYKSDAPKGVNGRSSDNSNFTRHFGWEPMIPLREGLGITYAWIYDQMAGPGASQVV